MGSLCREWERYLQHGSAIAPVIRLANSIQPEYTLAECHSKIPRRCVGYEGAGPTSCGKMGRRPELIRIVAAKSQPWIIPAATGSPGSGNRQAGIRQPAAEAEDDVERLNDARILIYSHDSFGLGHLRRCRAIAHAVVDRFKGVSVLILSGSPIIGSFDFRSRVDFVRIPGVIKLSDGEYQSLGLHIALDQTMEMRAAIIRQTALSFRPDLFIVDKEPLGLKGEVVPTLQMLKAQGTTLVLGLRDIMDEPKLLLKEWKRKQVLPALEHLYDEIWVYGLEEFADPVAGVACPLSVRKKIPVHGVSAPRGAAVDRSGRDPGRRAALRARDRGRRRRRHVGGRLGVARL